MGGRTLALVDSLSALHVALFLTGERHVYDGAMTPEDRARRIKVLIFDVDGVLTNGDITMSFARLGGLRLGIITKRNSQVVAIRARDLKLDFVYQGQAHKAHALREIAEKAGVTLDEISFVGDDIVDLPCLRICGLAIATANARPQVKAAAHYITPLPGGAGAGRDAIDFILTAQGSLTRVIEQYLDESDPTARASDIGIGNM